MNRPTLALSLPCLGRLVLELRHPAGLAETGDAVAAPSASCACSGTWLCTNSVARSGSMPSASNCAAAIRVRSRSCLRVLRHGDRVQVGDEVERVVVVLQAHPLPQRPR